MPPKSKLSIENPLPSSHHLVIVTQNNVLAWDSSSLRTVFTSGSGGILAARAASNGSGTLAVADSHLVVLHEIHQGMEKSCRLKGAEVGYRSRTTDFTWTRD